MAVPSLERARQVLDEYNLPDGVVVHSHGVARVAAEAARLVVEAGVPVDVGLVEVAAVLHDIDKTATRGSLDHGVLGSRWLTDMGFPELALPVASHPVSCLLDEARYPRGWPSVLVSIADRRVEQVFMTVDRRFEGLLERHPEHRASLELARPRAHALESELAQATGQDATEIEARLRAAWEAGA